MKKIFTLVLSLTMLLCMSTTAFAANTGVGTGDYTGEVKGSYVAGGSGGTVYSVDIKWEGLSFTYEAAGEQWNPSTHQYEEHSEAGWAGNTGKITVTNHSNAAITATPSYTKATGFESASVDFIIDGAAEGAASLTVASADNGDGTGSEKTGTITVTPTGSLPEGTSNATIGTITITIN